MSLDDRSKAQVITAYRRLEAENAIQALRLRELEAAARSLIKLQAHYAKLLNMHDGGERIPFESLEQFLERRAALALFPPRSPLVREETADRQVDVEEHKDPGDKS